MSHRRRTFHFVAAAVVLALAIAVGGCQLRSRSPATRYGAVMVYDPVEERAILFGGKGGLVERHLNDLWAFDSHLQTWARIRVSGRPPARSRPGIAYDPVHHQIVVFGGQGKGVRIGDTWVYDIAENRWEEVTPANSPTPRSDMGMAYDWANQVVIMFGGYCREDSRGQCDGTWSYDPEAKTWTEMLPPSSPPITYGPTLVYDDRNQRVLLWGGHMSTYQNGQLASAGYGDTLWSYDYPEDAWEEVSHARRPRARYWHSAAFDSAGGRLVVFGGDGGSGYLDDTWLYDVEEDTWRPVQSEEAPLPRINAAMAYDSSSEVIVLFGGLAEEFTQLRDTWVLKVREEGGAWTQVAP